MTRKLAVVLAALAAGAALIVAGVWLVAGLGAALIVAGLPVVAVAVVIDLDKPERTAP